MILIPQPLPLLPPHNPPPTPPRLIRHPNPRHAHNPLRSLILQAQLLEPRYHIPYLRLCQLPRSGVARDEAVEDGDTDSTTGFCEEDAGEEEVEGRVAEAFLGEAEEGGGEGGVGDA